MTTHLTRKCHWYFVPQRTEFTACGNWQINFRSLLKTTKDTSLVTCKTCIRTNEFKKKLATIIR